MIMTRKYYEEHVDMKVEIEDDFGRVWHTVKGDKVDAFIKKATAEEGSFLSDLDLSCRQSDDKVRYFLNLCDYNANHDLRYKGKGIWEVIEIALDNWDY